MGLGENRGIIRILKGLAIDILFNFLFGLFGKYCTVRAFL